MAKYIIDVPDNKEYAYVNDEKTFLRIPISLGENETKSISAPTFLRMTPYTEPSQKAIDLQHAHDIENVARMNYSKGTEDAWEFARNLLNYTDDDWDAIERMLLIDKCTYQEAKDKYEKWMKQKAEIRVGCEVHHKELPELKIYVTDMDDNSFGGFALCRVEDVCDYGDRFSECNVHQYKPTGRVLPNIVELLNKMEEE